MDAPQLIKQTIPADALRLPDLRLMAGPREIEFEIELPKGGSWYLEGPNELAVSSSNPLAVSPGHAMFQHLSMRFMVPVAAVRPGEAVLTYDLKVSWNDASGRHCTEQRQMVERVSIEANHGATVPWVHYKVNEGLGHGVATIGPVEE